VKRILEIGVYKPGDLRSEVIDLDEMAAHVEEDSLVFTGRVTVKSRFKDRDFSGFYQLTKVYLKHEEQWEVIASRTARLAGESAHGPTHHH
jgi:hypothetical protein